MVDWPSAEIFFRKLHDAGFNNAQQTMSKHYKLLIVNIIIQYEKAFSLIHVCLFTSKTLCDKKITNNHMLKQW